MFEMSRMVEIWIFVGLGVMVILFLMNGMARLYRKAGPHEALVVYGFRGTRIVRHEDLPRGASSWWRSPCRRRLCCAPVPRSAVG